jgi:hypothetical protein
MKEEKVMIHALLVLPGLYGAVILQTISEIVSRFGI